MFEANSKQKRRKLAIESLETRRVMATLPFGATEDDTGEFMLGRIAVTPVFLESDGSIDASTENWTSGHIQMVLDNIREGLNWWKDLLATKSTVHTLDWVIDTTYATTPKSTPYEPISRTSNAYTLWVSKFLSDVGFSGSANLETNIRDFNQSQREKLNTDWSFTIFVVNSQTDSDGSFAPGGSFSRAFAFAGGLFEVVPSTRPASTFAHETGHMFWARDEYTGGGNYYQHRGYYNAQNSNAIDLNPDPNFQQQLSIMSSGSNLQTAYDTLVTSDATLAQLGWKDSDGDGIFDVLDVPFLLEGTGRLNTANNTYRFVGRTTVQTLPNRNSAGLQNDITLNKIGRVEYRINSGAWTTLLTPNAYSSDLDLSIPTNGVQGTIEIRSIDPVTGITSNVFVGTIGNAPDVTTRQGIQGFVWNDADGSAAWSANEAGLAGMTVTLIDNNDQPLVLQQIVEPDNLPSGQFSNTLPGVRIDAIGEDVTGAIGIFEDPNASTGTKIFKPFSMSMNNYIDTFRSNSQQLRVRFDTPTSYVSLDAISVADNTDVRLEAFAADGTLLKRFERKGMLAGQKVTMEVGTDTAQIASIVARAFNGSAVKLDNLRYGPKASAVTASDGSFSIPYLPAGTYRVRVTPSANGYNVTSPTNGIQTVVLASAANQSHVDFGLKQAVSPWQNPNRREDVNNSGTVEPLDVLILINEINLNGSRSLDGSGLSSPPFYDVDGDRTLAPLDVLQVINYINRTGGAGSGSGEGETLKVATAPETSELAGMAFPSFVIDAKAELPTTWIVSNSTSRLLRASTDAERCGCPSCTAFGPAGEMSPALADIVQAQSSDSKKADQSSTKNLNVQPLAKDLVQSVDVLLADWQ